nr:ribonuclease H-like domain-containing protein [Tanacetum cinerariifolium]
MGYEHPNTTPETKSDEIIKSGVEELVPILSENEVTSEDKRECDVPVCENSPICDDHSKIISDSNNDDDISSDDDSFEDIEYVKASLLDPEIVSVEEKNVVYHEEEEVDLEDISQIQDVVLRVKLLSINRLIANIESLNDNPTFDHEKPVTCSVCEGMLRGGSCLPCNLKAEKLFIRDPNAYSFNNSNYLPQPQYENYLCNLYGNNSHDGYDCQQQFPLVYEQEPSYNQNYNDNYYPHDLPSFECQPMDQNIDFSGSDQIQTPHYSEIHPPSQDISDEVFQAKDLMKSIQTFLEEFNYIPFGEKPKILLQACVIILPSLTIMKIIHEIAASNSNQEKEKPPQDSDIRQLIRKECCIEVCEEQKQNMENTILELVEICRQKELYFMYDNVDDLIESALNFKLLSINSQCLNKEKQEVKNFIEQPTERRTRIIESLQNFRVIHKSSISLKNTSQFSPVHAVAPILSTKETEYSPSMGYEHPNTTPETESDEIIKSGVEELVPILSENEVTSEDKREYIEYVEASPPDPEIVSVEEENVVYHEEVEVDLEDIFQIQDVVLLEKLLSINRLIANIESLKDNPTPDRLLNSSVSFPISEESDNSLSDNSSPEFETFCDHTEETRSGNTTTHADNSLPEYDSFCFDIEPDQERLINVVKNDISDDSGHPFFKELLLDDSILFPNNESSESDFDNPSFPRPPPEPPDADFERNSGEEISVVMNDSDEFECLDPRNEFDVQIMKMMITFLSCLLFEFFCHILSILRCFLFFSPLRVRILFLTLVILNGDSPIQTRVVDGVVQPIAPTTAEQRLAKKNELKAQETLLMALPDKHQLKFNIHKDAKSLILRKGLKLISQLEIMGESLSQEDINLKFLRSLPTEWRTHTLIWRNKTDLEDQSLDDLFNKLKIYEAEVKNSSSTSPTTQNIAFMFSQNTDSTNKLVSAVTSVFATSTKVSVSTLLNVDNLSDAV